MNFSGPRIISVNASLTTNYKVPNLRNYKGL